MDGSVAFVSDAHKARAALTPLRRELLERLREPGSASSLAEEMDLPRQKLGYHLRVLEDAGLVQLVEERPRRGFTERVLMATADTFVVDPTLLHATRRVRVAQDKQSADHLVETAATAARDVARMRESADAAGKRLLTLTVDAEVAFATPADFDAFTDELSAAVAALAKKYSHARGRRYRLVALTHPAAKEPAGDPS